jgi:hypothetical protein
MQLSILVPNSSNEQITYLLRGNAVHLSILASLNDFPSILTSKIMILNVIEVSLANPNPNPSLGV